MKIFDTLEQVLQNLDELNWDGVLFVNSTAWESKPLEAKFVYLEGDDELDDIVDEETLLPRLAQENNVERFLGKQTFEDVIIKQRELDPESSPKDFVRALNYYLEYDTFYWPKK